MDQDSSRCARRVRKALSTTINIGCKAIGVCVLIAASPLLLAVGVVMTLDALSESEDRVSSE